MNGRMRLAVLAPLMVSSLALGSVTFLAAPAQSASKPSCGLSKTADPNKIQVSGQNFKPKKNVLFQSDAGGEGTAPTDAQGGFTSTLDGPEGTVTAVQIGGSEVTCGTVAATEEKTDKDTFTDGYNFGYNLAIKNCTKPNLANKPGDPMWDKGFDKGQEQALKDCKTSGR
ncbi:hypothetical protein ABZW44_45720 [Streptomyces mirabilis]|uniref:hypothetical protein n=1 Tax=Streptomyces mirabilis TaxID=68239 RepID=UPI0033A7D006